MKELSSNNPAGIFSQYGSTQNQVDAHQKIENEIAAARKRGAVSNDMFATIFAKAMGLKNTKIEQLEAEVKRLRERDSLWGRVKQWWRGLWVA